MPASNEALRSEVLEYLEARFGLTPHLFAGAEFSETADGEIWIASRGAPGRVARRPPGLRAVRRTPTGLKPTSAFLVSVGPQVSRSRVSLERDALVQLLLGRRLPCEGPDGYVAVTYGRDVLGCGAVGDGTLRSLLPTGRRRELLDILTA